MDNDTPSKFVAFKISKISFFLSVLNRSRISGVVDLAYKVRRDCQRAVAAVPRRANYVVE
jgi:hypothetical protein